MQSIDLSLIKMIKSHYYVKTDQIIRRIEYKGRTFFDKFEQINEPLDLSVLKRHLNGEIIVAHSLISDTNKVENLVFDYNGRSPERFWHRAQLLLREQGYINFTAYKTKTNGHLHLYIHKGHTAFDEGCQIINKLSMLLKSKMIQEWRVFPTLDIPREFNILTLPYELYQKERGASWAKHM